MTGDLFATLGVAHLVGRTLSAEDDRVGAAPVAVLSKGLWRRVLSSLVFGMATTDSLAIAGAVVGLMLVALGAIIGATRGATRTDPMVALRAE